MLEGLRKFGLKHHDLATMLDNASTLLRLLALDVDSRHTTLWNATIIFISIVFIIYVASIIYITNFYFCIPILIYVFSAITIAFYIYTYHLSTYWFIFWRGEGDLLFKILLFSLGISSLIGFIKLLYMYFNSEKLKQIASEYLLCDAAVAPNSRMRRNVQATLRRVKRRATIFWVVIISNGVLYILRPLLTPGRHFMEDQQILLGLEPMFESPNYEIAFTMLCFGIFLTVYAPANITGFIIIIVGYTEAQMLALSQELIHLWDDAESHYQNIFENPRRDDASRYASRFSRTEANDDIPNEARYADNVASANVFDLAHSRKRRNIINDYIKHCLISIMKTHAIQINLIKEVENIFQNAVAIEFTLLSCGLIAELLGGLENTYMEVPFALVQVAMDCITGQKLIDANMIFMEAVYDCKWENFDVSNMKLVMVLLQNAQKTMKFSAGGVASLSYMSLMSVIRSIYSAYTALRSTMV